jgi:CheY-like chemotaxis protein
VKEEQMITGSMTIRAPEQVDYAASRSPQSHLDQDIGAGEPRRLQVVLLIEDDRELADALAVRLQGTGLTVARAQDGASGLEKVRLLHPDLIILDLRLPRMEGDRFLHFLRMTAEHSAVPVIGHRKREEHRFDGARIVRRRGISRVEHVLIGRERFFVPAFGI